VVSALVGPEHNSAVQPKEMDNRFQRAHLMGRLANIVTEIPEGHEIADAALKAIVSGEICTVEHKRKNPFEFRPFVTCWFGTNHMPHTRDFSDALVRRAVVLTFNREFLEHEQDKGLREVLAAELPGILNRAIEGLGRLFANNRFTRSQSNEEAKLEWRVSCDQVAQFVEDRCAIEDDARETSSDLYREYRSWADEMGVRHRVAHKGFSARLVRLGAKLERTEKTRWVVGLRIKS
jgi:putative DNA primase/helicase